MPNHAAALMCRRAYERVVSNHYLTGWWKSCRDPGIRGRNESTGIEPLRGGVRTGAECGLTCDIGPFGVFPQNGSGSARIGGARHSQVLFSHW